MKKWKLGFIALSVSAAFSVHVVYAANPISQQQVNDLFCNSNLPIPSNLCPTSSPTARNPASQQYVCERYLAVKNIPKLGDCVGGGIVYYVDTIQKKGLIVALADVGTYQWSPNNNNLITSRNLFKGGPATTLGTNTFKMLDDSSLAALAAISPPAPACPVSMQSCTPWYLPSAYELVAAWNVAAVVSPLTCPSAVAFSSANYWSSSDEGFTTAWRVSFFDGSLTANIKSFNFRVRPVRAFSY